MLFFNYIVKVSQIIGLIRIGLQPNPQPARPTILSETLQITPKSMTKKAENLVTHSTTSPIRNNEQLPANTLGASTFIPSMPESVQKTEQTEAPSFIRTAPPTKKHTTPSPNTLQLAFGRSFTKQPPIKKPGTKKTATIIESSLPKLSDKMSKPTELVDQTSLPTQTALPTQTVLPTHSVFSTTTHLTKLSETTTFPVTSSTTENKQKLHDTTTSPITLQPILLPNTTPPNKPLINKIPTNASTRDAQYEKQHGEPSDSKHRPEVCLKERNIKNKTVIKNKPIIKNKPVIKNFLDPDLQNALGPVCLYSGTFGAKHNSRIIIDKEKCELYFVIATCALNEMLNRINTISCDKENVKYPEKPENYLADPNFYRNVIFTGETMLKDNDVHEEVNPSRFTYSQPISKDQKCVKARIEIKLNNDQKEILKNATKVVEYLNDEVNSDLNDNIDGFYWKNLQKIVIEELICQTKQMKLVLNTISSYINMKEKLKEITKETMEANTEALLEEKTKECTKQNTNETMEANMEVKAKENSIKHNEILAMESKMKNFFVYIKLLDLCIICDQLAQPCLFNEEADCDKVKANKFRKERKKDAKKLMDEIQSVAEMSNLTNPLKVKRYYFEKWMQKYENITHNESKNNGVEHSNHNKLTNSKIDYKTIMETILNTEKDIKSIEKEHEVEDDDSNDDQEDSDDYESDEEYDSYNDAREDIDDNDDSNNNQEDIHYSDDSNDAREDIDDIKDSNDAREDIEDNDEVNDAQEDIHNNDDQEDIHYSDDYESDKKYGNYNDDEEDIEDLPYRAYNPSDDS